MDMFPRVAMLIRDPSHAIRIAVSRPLKMEETFKDIFLELIGPERNERNKLACGSRGALIPDLTHSEKLITMLMAIQRAWHGEILCPKKGG